MSKKIKPKKIVWIKKNRDYRDFSDESLRVINKYYEDTDYIPNFDEWKEFETLEDCLACLRFLDLDHMERCFEYRHGSTYEPYDTQYKWNLNNGSILIHLEHFRL